MSMTQVWERLYLGGLDEAELLGSANPHGISTVISLSLTSVRNRARGLNYVHLRIQDAQPISVGEFDGIMDVVSENVRWGKVLIHCGSGISRAPIMTAAYMHIVGYKNIDAALGEIKKLRPIVDVSPILLESVREHLQ